MSFVHDPTYETKGSVHCDGLGCDRQTLVEMKRRNTRGWGAARAKYTFIPAYGWWFSGSGNSSMFDKEPHWRGSPDGIFLCPSCALMRKSKTTMNAIKVAMALRT
jgi:hypothetical protein